jgi:hypothetical protein
MASNVFCEPVQMGKLRFDNLTSSSRETFVDFLLHPGLCDGISFERERQLTHYVPAWHAFGALQQPSEDFIQWAEDAGVDFVVRRLWLNGCHITLINANDAVLVKLRWGIDQTKDQYG